MTVRAVRNNNPGNLRYTGTPWQGLASPESDGEFCVFRNPYYGIRAMARVLLTYYRHHGINTIRGVIERWAPPGENDTEAYIQAVTRMMTPGGRQDGADTMRRQLDRPDTLRWLCEAIAMHEAGFIPYAAEVFHEGVRMALEDE